MKYLPTFILLFSIVSTSVLAQMGNSITRSGQVANLSKPSSNKLAGLITINTSAKQEIKPTPTISGGATLFYESFDNVPGVTTSGPPYHFPVGWRRFNIDNGTPNAQVAYVNNAWARRDDFKFSPTDSVAFSTSYYTSSVQADDWMWTPLISGITSSSTLKWSAVTYDPAYKDGYEVRIMRASQGPPTGGIGAIGNQITNSTQVFSVAEEAISWTAHSVDLSAFGGDAIYIGFRNNSNDKFLLAIDDVLVESYFPYDLITTSTKNVSEYSVIPVNETMPLNFESTIYNNGFEQANQVQMQVNIKKETENFANLSSIITPADFIPANGSKTFTILNGFNPKNIGTYTFKYHQLFANTDLNPSNDTLAAFPLKVSRNTFSRVTGDVNGVLGIGAGAGLNGLLGTVFTLNTTEKLLGIMVKMNPVIGTKVKARIYATTSGVPNNPSSPLWESSLITLNDTENQSVFFTGNNPPILGPGTYWFGCLEIDSTLAIHQHREIFKPNTNFVSWAINPYGSSSWTPIETFGANFAKPFAIFPVFECPEDILVSTYIYQENLDKIAAGTIEANKLIFNSKVLFEAGRSITLKPGFSIVGNRFRAEIKNGCTNPDY